ncbi:MAG: signal peptidase I, partial [Bacteroidales bacterium]|nr:signal peptidase I [Bacteroidales bacterium]
VKYSSAREWLDALVFALIAAMIIRANCFEFYKIPSSSMEKSLLVGDYLMVSKIAYGPRAEMTPLSFPLVHNVLPLTDGQRESYLKWIKLPYHRFPGLRNVQRFDATVFNYPDGDTVCTAFQSNRSYHDVVREYGRETVLTDRTVFGNIVVRPVDKRENFIKRCIGLPGETLQIRDQQVLINGQPAQKPSEVEFTYAVRLSESVEDYIASMSQMGAYGNDLLNAKYQKDMRLFSSFGISNEDCDNSLGYYQYIFLTPEQIDVALQYKDYIKIEPMAYTHADSSRLVRMSPRYKLVSNPAYEKSLADAVNGISQALENVGVTRRSLELMGQIYTIPMTAETAQRMMASAAVAEVMPLSALCGYSGQELFPHAEGYEWSVDNFGPVTIPAKGMTVELNESTLPFYRRAIEVFEGNTLELRGGKVYINGSEASQYTFKQNYYWMMGDNRHNSADSRYWGFVPEDHIVGRASMIVFSKDADSHKIRWNRILKRKL